MKNLLLFLFLLNTSFAFGQNLVKNPSFEEVESEFFLTPCTYSRAFQFNNALFWKCANNTTTDILSYDAKYKNCFPTAPKTGKRMAGFIAYHPQKDSGYEKGYHEILEGQLTEPLEIGKIYTIQYWLYTDDSLGARHLWHGLGEKPSSAVNVFCNNIGVQFRTSKLNQNKNWNDSLAKNPQQYLTKEVIGNTNGWKKFQFLFTADKAYTNFYIGNFKDDKETLTNLSTAQMRSIDSLNSYVPDKTKKAVSVEKKKRIAYYCIDNVSLRKGNLIDAPVIFNEKSTYTFKNVTFETAKSVLISNSTAEIDALFDFLSKNPKLNVLIQGHTDNKGTEKSNQLLSEQRAQSVATYLTNKGFSNAKIKTEGFGSKNPIATNDSEEGRATNRSVEVKFW